MSGLNPSYPPITTTSTGPGLMTSAQATAIETAQTDATQAKTWSDPAASKTMGNAGTTQTFATLAATVLTAATELVSPLVRAVSSAAALRSDLGAGATDVAAKIGTSIANASVNSAAKIASFRTGIGGTEVERSYVGKDNFTFVGAISSTLISIIERNGGASSQFAFRISSFFPMAFDISSGSAWFHYPSKWFNASGTTEFARVENGDFKSFVVGSGVTLRSPNGTSYRLTVSDAGALVITAV